MKWQASLQVAHLQKKNVERWEVLGSCKRAEAPLFHGILAAPPPP